MSGNRLIWLRLCGFEANPQLVRTRAPLLDAVCHARGQGRRHGGTYDANSIAWKLAYASTTSWSKAFDELVQAFGGLRQIEQMVADIAPRQRSIEYWIPARGSPLQENNYIESSTLAQMTHLGLDLGFEFPEFEDEY